MDEGSSWRPTNTTDRLPTVSVEADLDLALRVAEDAAALAHSLFRSGSPTTTKSDGSVVTEADVAVERQIREQLQRWRPDDRVVGEELGGAGAGPRRWIIDPIDGTRNFVAGGAEWGVNVALQDADDLVVGVVVAPELGQRWWGGRGIGAFQSPTEVPARDGVPLRVSAREHLDDATVSAWLDEGHPALDRLRALPGWEEPSNIAMMFRVPAGTLDVLVDGTRSMIWDRAPLIVLVEEAGGRYSDLAGGRNYESHGGFFTNGHVHEAARQVVSHSEQSDL